MSRRSSPQRAKASERGKSEGARTVGRVLRALELLASTSEPLRLTEIARALDVPTSSAHALLQQLVRYEYAKPVGPERRYAQGDGLMLLGTRVRSSLHVVKVARPIIEEIAASTGENVYLGLRHSRGIVYADSVEAESGVMARFPVGSLRPLHASSPGKVFLAFHVPPAQLDSVLGPDPLPAFNRYTTTSRAVLREQLEEIRSRGYAINEQEVVEGAFGVSVPIFGADRSLAACLTIGMPGLRFKSRKDMVLKKAVAGANEISLGLGQPDWDGIVKSFRKQAQR